MNWFVIYSIRGLQKDVPVLVRCYLFYRFGGCPPEIPVFTINLEASCRCFFPIRGSPRPGHRVHQDPPGPCPRGSCWVPAQSRCAPEAAAEPGWNAPCGKKYLKPCTQRSSLELPILGLSDFFFGENLSKFDGWSAPLFRIVISGSPWLDKPIYHHLSPPCSWQTLYRFTTVCFMQKTILCIWYMYIYIYIYTRLITHNPPETKNSKGSVAADLWIWIELLQLRQQLLWHSEVIFIVSDGLQIWLLEIPIMGPFIR